MKRSLARAFFAKPGRVVIVRASDMCQHPVGGVRDRGDCKYVSAASGCGGVVALDGKEVDDDDDEEFGMHKGMESDGG